MKNLLEMLTEWNFAEPNAPMHFRKINGKWNPVTVSEVVQNVTNFALAMRNAGIGKNDLGIITSYNRSEWLQAELGMLLAQVTSGGIYLNSSQHHAKQIYQLKNVKVLGFDNLDSYKKFLGADEALKLVPALRMVLFFDQIDTSDSSLNVFKKHSEKNVEILLWNDLISAQKSKSQEITKNEFKKMLSEIDGKDRAVNIFTSGTTGKPKAVSLSHDNLSFAATCYTESWEAPKKGKLFSFLPLAHIAEKSTALGLGISMRYAVYFCSSPLNIISELQEVQPTIILCVPRFWEKLREGAEAKLSKLPNSKQKLFNIANKIAIKHLNYSLKKQRNHWLWSTLYNYFDKLILMKIKWSLGLSEADRHVSGAAALSADTLVWFRGLGIPIIEAYAMSESSGIITCGVATEETAFTVGVPYKGIEIKLADDGEILTRGPHIFKGYYEDENSTQEMLDGDWLKTGDLGKINSDGHLKIVGRKREIIKLSEGKMIPPLYLEDRLLASKYIDQAIVIGNERPFLVALLTLSDVGKALAKSDSDKLKSEIKQHVQSINSSVARHERIQKYEILENPFSIDNDEITATMKIKRKNIETNYGKQIEQLFS